MHDKQSLVLLHLGNGTGEELLTLAADIKAALPLRFAVTLQIGQTVS